MKLRQIKIQDFRALTELEWNFTDELGKVRPLTIIIGPNGSGKSSILDAVWFGLMSIIGYKIQRIGFRAENDYVVRNGANYSKIDYELEISDAEHEQIKTWKAELVQRGAIKNYKFPETRYAKLAWTYPAQPNYKTEYYNYGGYQYQLDWALLQGHNYYRRLQSINAQMLSERNLRGGVYLFEQERRFNAEPVRDIETKRDFEPDAISQQTMATAFDIRKELIRLRTFANFGNDPRYQQIQESFNYICAPHEMRDIIAKNEELNIEFRAGNDNSYTFDGLSSGERSILYFLTRYVMMQAHNAIVLIDELEMHLHPTWQRRLYESLQRFDSSNQFIITTHSPIVESIAPAGAVILLGDLDIPVWQLEMTYNDED